MPRRLIDREGCDICLQRLSGFLYCLVNFDRHGSFGLCDEVDKLTLRG
jgi:hypothetical protein